jgi:hypothetical protein
MGALTYFFAHLGPHPLDAAFAESAPAEASEPVRPPIRVAPAVSGPKLQDFAAPVAADDGARVEEPAPSAAPNSVVESDEPPHSTEAQARSPRRDSAQTEPRRARSVDESSPRVALALPEFTDSSRREAPVRAADGPRIDSLFEPEAPWTTPHAPDAPPLEGAAPARITSCEAAMARNTEEIAIGGPAAAPDVTREAYASILQNGRYLSGCRIPSRTVFEICAAVRDGRAVGITVVSNPADSSVNACVRSAVARLRFPSSPKLDVTHTRFDAAER